MSKPKHHRLDGFQKPLDSGQRRKVRVAVIRTGETDGGTKFAECSCGKPFVQKRDKVRETAIQAHLDKKHGGRGLWL